MITSAAITPLLHQQQHTDSLAMSCIDEQRFSIFQRLEGLPVNEESLCAGRNELRSKAPTVQVAHAKLYNL